MAWKHLFIQSVFKLISVGSSHNGLQNLSNSSRGKFVSLFLMCSGGSVQIGSSLSSLPELISGGRKTLPHFDQTENFV